MGLGTACGWGDSLGAFLGVFRSPMRRACLGHGLLQRAYGLVGFSSINASRRCVHV